MRSKRALLCAAIAVTIAGCSIGRPIMAPTTYIVDVPSSRSRTDVRIEESVRIGNVRIAAPFGKDRLIYRLDDVRYIADPYNAFAADPREILSNRVAEWLQHSGPFSSVAPPGSTRPSAYVLEMFVSEMYGDFREGIPAAAVLVIEVALIDQRGARPQVMYARSMRQSVPLATSSAGDLVRGYGIALSDALALLTAEVDEKYRATSAR